MRILYLLTSVYIGLSLTSCASSKNNPPPTVITVEKVTTANNTSKDPMTVDVYHKTTQLKHSYKIIGKEIVSSYNIYGNKRQEATIRDTMRKIAAEMGGDAIIDISRQKTTVTGTVIQFTDTV